MSHFALGISIKQGNVNSLTQSYFGIYCGLCYTRVNDQNQPKLMFAFSCFVTFVAISLSIESRHVTQQVLRFVIEPHHQSSYLAYLAYMHAQNMQAVICNGKYFMHTQVILSIRKLFKAYARYLMYMQDILYLFTYLAIICMQ